MEREISRLAAAAAEKLLGKNQAEAAQMAAQQAEKDPLTQIQRAELQIKEREMALKEAEAKHKALLDMEKLKLDAQKTGANIALSEDRLDAEMQRDAANTAIRAAVQLDASARKERDKGAEIGLRAAEMALDRASQSNGGGTDGAA